MMTRRGKRINLYATMNHLSVQRLQRGETALDNRTSTVVVKEMMEDTINGSILRYCF